MPRIIYRLIVQVESDDLPPATAYFSVQLDRSGNCNRCQPCPPKTRFIDLRAGDSFYHRPSRRTRKILAIKTESDSIRDSPPPDDDHGYIVRGG